MRRQIHRKKSHFANLSSSPQRRINREERSRGGSDDSPRVHGLTAVHALNHRSPPVRHPWLDQPPLGAWTFDRSYRTLTVSATQLVEALGKNSCSRVSTFISSYQHTSWRHRSTSGCAAEAGWLLRGFV